MSDMFASWIYSTWPSIAMVGLSAVGIYMSLMIFTRMSGLRSFSKMSSFDFALTVAIGSLVGTSIVTDSPPMFQGIAAIAAVYILQFIVSHARRRLEWAGHAVDNEPLLLMAGPRILHDNLSQARVTIDDLRAKLREANVTTLDQVRAVVMETTGDISVLHAPPDDPPLDLRLMADVIDRDRLDDVEKVQHYDEPGE